MKEKQKHMDAFEHYYALGANRTLKKLHQDYTKNTPDSAPSIDAIKLWSSNFNWQERIMLRNKDVSQKVEKKIVKEEEDIRLKSYRRAKHVGDILSSALGTAFYEDKKNKGKMKLRPEITISSARELKEVAIGALRCEVEALRILAPEEELKIEGTIETIIKVHYEDEDKDTNE